jgi:hypothetical protein
VLYIDFIDRDPPLISYINLPIVWFANCFGQPIIFCYNIFVCLCVLFSCTVMEQLFRANQAESDCHHIWLLSAYALFNLLIGPEFGTREHLLILFGLPYLFARIGRSKGAMPSKRLAIICGIAGGIAFNLDWLFLLYPVVIEFYLLLNNGKVGFIRAAEVKSFLIVTAIYLAHFPLMRTEAFSNYFNIVVPLSRVLCDVPDMILSFIGKSPDRRDVICLFIPALIVAFLYRKKSSYAMPLTMIGFAGLQIYIFRSLGFSRELLPVMFSSTMLAALAVSIAFDTRLMPPRSLETYAKIVTATLVGVCCLASGWYLTRDASIFNLHPTDPQTTISDEGPFVKDLDKITLHGDRILFLDGFERPAYPLTLQLGLEPTSKWAYMFPLRAFAKLEMEQPNSRLLALKPLFLEQLRKDIENLKPRVIAVQSGEIGFAIETDEFRKFLLLSYHVEPQLTYEMYKEYQNTQQHRLEIVGDEFPYALYVRNSL